MSMVDWLWWVISMLELRSTTTAVVLYNFKTQRISFAFNFVATQRKKRSEDQTVGKNGERRIKGRTH